jgi:hypothetical protein
MYTYDSVIKGLFDWCVHVLVVGSKHLGISYEELNIYLFVILHPLVTILLAVLLFRRNSPRLRGLRVANVYRGERVGDS